jgi:hypothetical protein
MIYLHWIKGSYTAMEKNKCEEMGSEWQTLNFFIYEYLKMGNLREKNYISGKLSPSKLSHN